ncbi:MULTISPECIES: energy transducer TonB [Oxalobacteraceae]|uniref:energy transducer TonB n=1 Tax=Herminiimonas sp. Marseille-P9896 TaxID=2742211 RepID=UPI00158A1450|nr:MULTISPECIES: hypothetical protein [Oxalobacteraceae]
MKMPAFIRKKTATERLAMLLSLFVHGGLAVGFVYAVHGSVGGGTYASESSAMIVDLLSVQKETRSAGKSMQTDINVDKTDIANHRTSTADVVEKSVASKDQADLLPQARGSADAAASSLFNLIALPKPYYFQPTELTEQPAVVVDISPDLDALFASGLAQMAVLDLFINESGDIDDVLIENSSLSESAQQLIKDAFSKTKFNPGKVAGMPVKSQLKIEVVLEGRAVENIAKKAE